jgi:hypothetical protein
MEEFDRAPAWLRELLRYSAVSWSPREPQAWRRQGYSRDQIVAHLKRLDTELHEKSLREALGR